MINIEPGKLAEGINMKQKRSVKSKSSIFSLFFKGHEKLSLIAYEGSCLTLMGLVRYDKFANNGEGAFKMTDVLSFVAGGF